MRLEVPRGDAVVPITITDRMLSIRFSLKTSEPGEAKRPQAEAIAYLEGIYANLRANKPVPLTHRQCVALSGELYRSWAADLEAAPSISIQNEADGSTTTSYERDQEALETEAFAADAEAGKAERLDGARLEEQLGPVVDRLLARRGITTVDAVSRGMRLMEFSRALAEWALQ